jgi:hypothetical protein
MSQPAVDVAQTGSMKQEKVRPIDQVHQSARTVLMEQVEVEVVVTPAIPQ